MGPPPQKKQSPLSCDALGGGQMSRRSLRSGRVLPPVPQQGGVRAGGASKRAQTGDSSNNRSAPAKRLRREDAPRVGPSALGASSSSRVASLQVGVIIPSKLEPVKLPPVVQPRVGDDNVKNEAVASRGALRASSSSAAAGPLDGGPQIDTAVNHRQRAFEHVLQARKLEEARRAAHIAAKLPGVPRLTGVRALCASSPFNIGSTVFYRCGRARFHHRCFATAQQTACV
jgi:hypothetical protein